MRIIMEMQISFYVELTLFRRGIGEISGHKSVDRNQWTEISGSEISG